MASSLSSFNLEVVIWHILALHSILSDVDEADDSTRGRVAEASKGNAALDELRRLELGHVLAEVSIDVAPHEGAAGATQGPAAVLEVTRGVYLVDLVALVGVPAGADHRGGEGVLICVDNFTHHGCG